MMLLAVLSLVLSTITLVICGVLFRQLAIFIMGTARGVDASGIPPGRYFPEIEVATVEGEKVRLPLKGEPQIVFFGSTSCSECADIYPDALRLAQENDVAFVNMLFAENTAAARDYASNLEIAGLSVFTTPKIAAKYDVSATPFAYAVDDEGVIQAKGLLNDFQRLTALMGSISPQQDRRHQEA